MNLSKVYFYILIIVIQILSVTISTITEDLKDEKYFNILFKITLSIGFLGIIMEFLGWNYFCKYNCILMTFSPFIFLTISKGIIYLYKDVIEREGFQMQGGKLKDGFWTKNNGDVKERKYNGFYSSILSALPFLTVAILFLAIEKNIC